MLCEKEGQHQAAVAAGDGPYVGKGRPRRRALQRGRLQRAHARTQRRQLRRICVGRAARRRQLALQLSAAPGGALHTTTTANKRLPSFRP
jgi:hypothetical protein